jgi:hypothetical protein
MAMDVAAVERRRMAREKFAGDPRAASYCVAW